MLTWGRRRTLEAGFATRCARPRFRRPQRGAALWDGIASGLIAGPTDVLAALPDSGFPGQGGHADSANNVSRDIEELRRSRATNACNGADDCRRAVRRRILAGRRRNQVHGDGQDGTATSPAA